LRGLVLLVLVIGWLLLLLLEQVLANTVERERESEGEGKAAYFPEEEGNLNKKMKRMNE
jgi:hypothetical protein